MPSFFEDTSIAYRQKNFFNFLVPFIESQYPISLEPMETEKPDTKTSEDYEPNMHIGEFTISNDDNDVTVDYKPENVVYQSLHDQIFKEIYFPNEWKNEGIFAPNLASKQKTEGVCNDLYEKYNIFPFRVVPNKEEGITIIYRNHDNNRSLIIEVYNNLEIAGLVNDDLNKEIIVSMDIKEELTYQNLMKHYSDL